MRESRMSSEAREPSTGADIAAPLSAFHRASALKLKEAMKTQWADVAAIPDERFALLVREAETAWTHKAYDEDTRLKSGTKGMILPVGLTGSFVAGALSGVGLGWMAGVGTGVAGVALTLWGNRHSTPPEVAARQGKPDEYIAQRTRYVSEHIVRTYGLSQRTPG